MADLLKHVGGGQRWIDAALRERATDQSDVQWRSPSDGDDLLEWFEEGLASLIETARGVDREAPMRMLWNSDGVSGGCDFLRRRATNEAAIHRWDAERAVRDPAPIPPALAIDCLDELLARWLPWAASTGRQAQGRWWSGESISLRTAGRSWTVTFVAPGSVRVDADDHGPPDATAVVEGPPSAMVRFAMNRAGVGEVDLRFAGDQDLVARWRTEVRFGSRSPAAATEG